jgi:hypothetical protein
MTHSPVRSHTQSGKSIPRSDGPEARSPKAPQIATGLPVDQPVLATSRPEAFRWSSVDLGPELPMSVFTSTERWNPERIGAVAIYCSDGRYGESFDEFCHKHLQIPRYDRLAVAGGPACFAPGDEKAKRLCDAVLEQLTFLVKAHELKRIVLITHYGCGVYAERLQRPPDDCLPIQMADLRAVAETLRRRFESVKIETYLAMRRGSAVSFHAQTC